MVSSYSINLRLLDPKRKTFQSIVEEVRRPRTKSSTHQASSVKTFKNVAQTVMTSSDAKSEDMNEDVCDSRVSDIESEDSDWSDEDREELEKMFGAMSARGQKIDRMRRVRKSIRNGVRSIISDYFFVRSY